MNVARPPTWGSRQSWSGIADWYDELLSNGSGPHETALGCLADLLSDVADQRIIDVGCGQGLAARMLASRRASVLGVDASEAMIINARRHGTPAGPEIDYLVESADALSSIDDESFDGAVCQLALMDIADLEATLEAIARVLRPEGWLSFVIGHPCFLAPDAEPASTADGRPAVTLTDYFEERFWWSTNPQGVRRAGNHHRTLSTYLNALTGAGLTLEETREPVANELLAEQQPLYSRVPIFFAARVRKIS